MSSRDNNPFKGVNKVCAQCINDCKQFENILLVQCPKFQSIRTETSLSSRRARSAVVQNKGVKSAKQYQGIYTDQGLEGKWQVKQSQD
jgi:hypothetical protein